MREIIIIWVAIILIVVSLLFPPFGYTSYTVHPLLNTELIDPSKLADVSETFKDYRVVIPWRYVGHRFIFSPPFTDPHLQKVYSGFDKKRAVSESSDVDDMRIAWPLVAVQIVIIILVAGGLLLTFRMRRKRVS